MTPDLNVFRNTSIRSVKIESFSSSISACSFSIKSSSSSKCLTFCCIFSTWLTNQQKKNWLIPKMYTWTREILTMSKITDIENHELETWASIIVATKCSISLSSWSANNFARAAVAPRAVPMAALIRSVNGMSSFTSAE